MFGYIVTYKPELKFREFDEYRAFYCGLCRSLGTKYGSFGRLTLSYDMTFLAILLSGLYEPDTTSGCKRCVAHPFSKHSFVSNECIDYAADVNMILSYYKACDDWEDERKVGKYFFAKLLRKKNNLIAGKYPEKTMKVLTGLQKIHEREKNGEESIDEMSDLFGNILGELFVYRNDEWADELTRIGFYLGKFIYILDAFDDVEKDVKKGNYNPFVEQRREADFEEHVKEILTIMIGECCKTFEILPIIKELPLLRNILYAGVWERYNAICAARQKRRKRPDSE